MGVGLGGAAGASHPRFDAASASSVSSASSSALGSSAGLSSPPPKSGATGRLEAEVLEEAGAERAAAATILWGATFGVKATAGAARAMARRGAHGSSTCAGTRLCPLSQRVIGRAARSP